MTMLFVAMPEIGIKANAATVALSIDSSSGVITSKKTVTFPSNTIFRVGITLGESPVTISSWADLGNINTNVSEMNVTNLFVNNINGVLKQTNMATGTATTGFLAFAGPAGTAAWAAPGFQPSNTNLTSIAGIPSVDGDILVFTNGGWYKLPRGSANQVLQMDSGGNYPLWGTGNTNPITGLTYDIDITTTTFGSDPISIWTNTLSTNTTLLVWNAIGVVAGPTNINSTKIERAQFHRYDSTVIDDGSNTLGSVTAIVLRTNGNTVEAIATGAAGETNNIRLRGFYLTITNGFSTTLIFTNAISPTISP